LINVFLIPTNVPIASHCKIRSTYAVFIDQVDQHVTFSAYRSASYGHFLGTGEDFRGSNIQSYPVRPQVAERGALSFGVWVVMYLQKA
jgi:hypothetical protein